MTTTIDAATATFPPLEAEAQAFANASADPPFLYDLGPARGYFLAGVERPGA